MRIGTPLAANSLRCLAGATVASAAVVGFGSAPAGAAVKIDNVKPALSGEFPCSATGPISEVSQDTLSRRILGGSPSALDRIRLSQTAGAVPSENALPIGRIASAGPEGAAGRGLLAPASRTRRPFNQPWHDGAADACGVGAEAPSGKIDAASAYIPARAPEFDTSMELGTRPIAIKHTRFDARWASVRRAAPPQLMRAELGKADVRSGLNEEEIFARVNRWVNRRIAYRADDQNYRQRDFWATAQQTIARGSGDCEDFAILKMHMLRAAGIAPTRMKLVLLRDLAANADHAFLLVRTDKGDVVLDNTTDRVYSGREAVAVRPVLSFGATGQWVHGYRNEDRQPVIASIPATGQRVALASVDQRSVSAVPLIFKTGFSR